MIHPEYSSPECHDPYEAALYSHAGDLVIGRMGRYVSKTGGRLVFSRDNGVDGSYGSHESYLTFAGFSTSDGMRAFLMHLATRTLITGAGCVTDEGRFILSSRMATAACGVGGRLMDGCLVNLDRSHPSYLNQYERLHVRLGDANVSHWATAFKLASTALVLRACEAGYFDRDAEYEDLSDLGWKVGLLDGVSKKEPAYAAGLTAQEYLYERCLQFSKKWRAPAWTERCLCDWQKCIKALRGHGAERRYVGTRIDWMVKRELISRLTADLRSQIGGRQMVHHLYHAVESDRNLSRPASQQGLLRIKWSRKQLAHAARLPPNCSRPQARAAARMTGAHFIDWESARLDEVETPFPIPDCT